MNIFRKSNKWLRYRTIAKLKIEHKELYDKKSRIIVRQFKNFITESDQWWFVFIFVLATFLISPLINLDFINFVQIDYKTAINIVDQRTTNIAAIFSITLVVVGFMLNNLAVKSPLVYGLLFKKSLLYPVIYLTLSVIGTFIIISTLRDTLPPFFFTRVVLAGTYFAILILFLIGMLFRKVLLFANEKEIEKMLDEELIIEAKNNLKQILMQRYSEDIFVSIMKEYGAKEYNWSHFWGSVTNLDQKAETRIIENVVNYQSLYDVNLDSIITFVKQKNADEEILFKKLAINSRVMKGDNIIWIHNKTKTKDEKKKLQQCFIMKDIPNKQKDNNAMRKFCDDKFERLSEQDNHRSMEQVLKSYLKLYELQMQNQK